MKQRADFPRVFEFTIRDFLGVLHSVLVCLSMFDRCAIVFGSPQGHNMCWSCPSELDLHAKTFGNSNMQLACCTGFFKKMYATHTWMQGEVSSVRLLVHKNFHVRLLSLQTCCIIRCSSSFSNSLSQFPSSFLRRKPTSMSDALLSSVVVFRARAAELNMEEAAVEKAIEEGIGTLG